MVGGGDGGEEREVERGNGGMKRYERMNELRM